MVELIEGGDCVGRVDEVRWIARAVAVLSASC